MTFKTGNVALSNQPVHTQLEIKKTETRHLTQAMFKRQLSNGEAADREWLIYSPSQGKMYCFCANYFRMLILHLTQADLMTGTMHLRPLRIMKMDRNTGNA
jgi:hypothetical protein